MMRITGLDHLTMLDLAPPEFVAVAAGAGFDAVGLRVAPVSPGEQAWPVAPGSPMLAETMRRCGGTGLFVLDVEAIPLGPGSDLAGCEAVLETAAVLGARYLNVICDDPDTGRFADRLAELVRLARPYRVRPVIEFTAWRPIRTLASAVAIARGSDGAGLLLDTLHIQRCGVTAAELAAVDQALLGYLQLCDAPARPPHGMFGSTTTRCLVRPRSTPGPVAAISPNVSCPTTHGNDGGCRRPACRARSDPQMPTPRTWTSTSPGPGSGSGQSLTTRSARGSASSTTARISRAPTGAPAGCAARTGRG